MKLPKQQSKLKTKKTKVAKAVEQGDKKKERTTQSNYGTEKGIVFDIETTTEENSQTWLITAAYLGASSLEDVWLWKGEHVWFDFIEWLFKEAHRGYNLYAHNLTFDNSHFLSFMRDNFEHIEDNKDIKGCFRTWAIRANELGGKVMSYKMRFNSCTLKLIDTAVKFSADLAETMSTYTDMVKGDTPLYPSMRDVQYSDYDLEYGKSDTLGLVKAIPEISRNGTALTVASDAFASWKYTLIESFEKSLDICENTGKPYTADEKAEIAIKLFNRHYYPLDIILDKLIRPSYRGGFTFLNPLYKDVVLRNVTVFDVNSMYPAQMYNQLLPYGEPTPFKGKVYIKKGFERRRVGIQRISFDYALCREGYCPFIVTRNGFRGANEYGLEVMPQIGDTRCFEMLTLQELEMFLEHYAVFGLQYDGGFLFNAKVGDFREYIDKYMAMKNSKDPVIKRMGKLFLNSLYGKFAESPYKPKLKFDFKNPTLRLIRDTDSSIYDNQKDLIATFEEYEENYWTLETEEYVDKRGNTRTRRKRIPVPEMYKECKTKGYLPIGVFITSYARIALMTAIQAIGIENFIYCDTDSIHVREGTDFSSLDIHPSRLGAWKAEGTFAEAKYIRAKRYMGIYADGKTKVVCAGIKTEDSEAQIKTLADFYEGKKVNTAKFVTGVNGKYQRKQTTTI